MSEPQTSEPTDDLASYQSVKRVLAGEITAIHPGGCYVKGKDGGQTFRLFPEGMTARYSPVLGDFWIVYGGGYQALSPRAEFLQGYLEMNGSTEA